MIVTCNRIPVNPEHAAAFEERFADRASLVDGMPGFISFQLLRPKAEGDPYVVMTFWESDDAFQNWTQSPAFKEGHARSGTLPPQTFAGHPKLEVYDVIQSTTKIERLIEQE
ncbi:MAG TPA: antibiotic biosynthesis monooxygenase [Phototrophicaceae bacterium]|nr:antibiotic biosynthesis monooxygenase [Phototrophicaceae bacterium]